MHIRLVESDHRIKNHLQLIASTLSMEARNAPDPETADILLHACARVVAIARVHARLQTLDFENKVDMVLFLPELCRDLQACFNDAGAPHIDLEAETDSPPLPAKSALAIGGLVSELVTNAVKHGHEPGETSTVRVRLKRDALGGRLTVADSGPGLGEFAPGEKHNGIGFQLLQALADQLRGSVEFDPVQKGTSVSVLFAPDPPERGPKP